MKDSGSSLKMSAAFTNPTSGKIDQQRKILEVRALATLSLGHTKWRHMVIIMVSFSYYPNVCGYRGCLSSIKPLPLGKDDNLSRFSGRQHKPIVSLTLFGHNDSCKMLSTSLFKLFPQSSICRQLKCPLFPLSLGLENEVGCVLFSPLQGLSRSNFSEWLWATKNHRLSDLK